MSLPKLRHKSYNLANVVDVLNKHLVTEGDTKLGLFDVLKYIEAKELSIWLEIDHRRDQDIYIQSGNSNAKGEYQLSKPTNEAGLIRIRSKNFRYVPLDDLPNNEDKNTLITRNSIIHRLSSQFRDALFILAYDEEKKQYDFIYEGTLPYADTVFKDGRLFLKKEVVETPINAMRACLSSHIEKCSSDNEIRARLTGIVELYKDVKSNNEIKRIAKEEIAELTDVVKQLFKATTYLTKIDVSQVEIGYWHQAYELKNIKEY